MNILNLNRWLARLLILLLVAILDKSLGLPLWSVWLFCMIAPRLKWSGRIALLLISSLAMSSLLIFPWAILIIFYWLGYWWLIAGQQFLNSHNMRLLLIGVMSLLMMWGWQGIHWGQFYYLLISMGVMAIWLKRRRWYLYE